MKIDRRAFLSASFLVLITRVPGLTLAPAAATTTTPPPAAAAATPPPAAAAALPASPTSGTAFYGNPNTMVSVINTRAGIISSRLSGQIPCFVQVSANGITCTGTRALTSGSVAAVPYEDLEYTWNFGDPNGTEIFVRPTDGTSVNANIQQGPEAAYCYRRAGSYTITLTIRGKNGSGYVTSTVTQAITVSAFAATPGSEYWVDSVHGSDSKSGTSANAPKKSLSFLQSGSGGTIPNWPGTKKISGSIAIHLAQGSHWVVPSGLVVPNVNAYGGPACNLRIDSFLGAGGAGAQPIIEVTGTTAAFDSGSPGPNNTKTNFVISGVKFTNSGSASKSTLVNINFGNIGFGPETMTDIYLDNCIVANTLNIPSFMNVIATGSGDAGSLFSNMGIWGGAITGTIFNTSPLTKHAIFGGPTSWWFVFGCTISGSGANAILDHHIYPETQYHSLYKWITFGPTGTTSNSQRNYCINTNVDRVGSQLTIASCFLISENSMSGTKLIHDIDNVTNDPTQVQFINFVTEKNAIFNIRDVSATPEAGGILFGCGKSVTVRDNRVWNCYGFFAPFGYSASVLSASIYRNYIYIPASSTVKMSSIEIAGQTSGMTAPAVTQGSPILLLASRNVIPVGTKVTLSGKLPSPLTAGTSYYINSRPTPGSTCTLSTTVGGPSIAWDGVTAGSGTLQMQQHVTAPQWITDNVIQDERSSPVVLEISSADQVGARSLIDRNQYWKTGASSVTQFFLDNQSLRSIVRWQMILLGKCFDVTGSVTKPLWAAPPTKWSDFGA